KFFHLEADIKKIVSDPAKTSNLEDIINYLLLERKSLMILHGRKQSEDHHSLDKNYELASEFKSFEDNSYLIRPILLEDKREFHKITMMEELKKYITSYSIIKWLSSTDT